MLEVKNISSGYGKKQVLFGVSFEVKDGDVVLLTGGNGSGKSTLLKCIYNVLPCWSGEIYFDGERINNLRSFNLVCRGIVYIPQKDFCFDRLTVKENLQVSGSIYSYKKNKQKMETVFEIIPSLKVIINRYPVDLSGGERKILSIGIGLIHEPKLILFDEPFSGLDINNKKNIKKIINNLNSNNIISLLVVEHKSDSFNFKNIIRL